MSNIVQDLQIVGKYLPYVIGLEAGQAQSIPIPEETFEIPAGAAGTFKVTTPATTVTIQKIA